MVGRCDSSEVLVSSRVGREICCVGQRTEFALAFIAIVLCALLFVRSVVLPGWAMNETKGQTVYTGLLFTCFNDTLSMSGCVVGHPFEHAAGVCVCVWGGYWGRWVGG